MSEADKMFEELGYENINHTDIFERIYCISFKKDDDNIDFMLDYKQICFNNDFESPMYFDSMNFIKITEAIKEKVKELGWL